MLVQPGEPTILEIALQWMKQRPLKAVFLMVLSVVVGFTLYGVSRPASHDRDFVEHLSRLPHVESNEDAFSIAPVRAWRYSGNEVGEKHWQEEKQVYRYDELENIWFVVEPHPGLNAMAHTLVLFEFSDDRLLGLTIEARREVGEKYSAFWGNWGKFELAYIWADAQDLLLRRAVYLNHEIEIYPVAEADVYGPQLLRDLLDNTQAIEAKPRLYNTLFSNCTNELAKTAGFDWAPAFILTGYAADYLHSNGLLASRREFDDLKRIANVTNKLRAYPAPAGDRRIFDRWLLEELRQTAF